MDRDAQVSQIVAFTSLSPEHASQYLDFANGDVERAVTLFFESPNLVSDAAPPGAQGASSGSTSRQDPIPLDSDDERSYVDDEEFARQLQNAENQRVTEPEVRAPVARQTDVLVDDYAPAAPTVHQVRSIWAGSSRLGGMYSLPPQIQITRDIESAKELGRRKRKPILVDMQLPSVFDCSCLVRDLWNDTGVLDFIVSNFVFVQYTERDGMWETFKTLYMQDETLMGHEAFPYVAMIDPCTGERVYKWVGKGAFPMSPPTRKSLFDAVAFKAELASVLAEKFPKGYFSGLGSAGAAIQELSDSDEEGDADDDDDDDDDDDIILNDSIDAMSIHSIELEPVSKFDAIVATDFPQPARGPDTTAIQFRFPDGQRRVRHFRLDDPVVRMYEWLKANPLDDSFVGREFLLLFNRLNLINKLEETIEGAGLKRASVTVEPGAEPDDMGPQI